jgi:hypothetical protein
MQKDYVTKLGPFGGQNDAKEVVLVYCLLPEVSCVLLSGEFGKPLSEMIDRARVQDLDSQIP